MLQYAPNEQGVYALFRDGDPIYIGCARQGMTIRTCLLLHQDGSLGACTIGATHYTWEITRWSSSRWKEILLEFHKENGREPRCQSAAA
jgi:hypothetical protein